MRVKNLCKPDVVKVGPRESVVEAARRMREHHVGYLVVTDDAEGAPAVPVGVLTDRDIVVEAVAQSVDPATLTVADIMSRQPSTLDGEVELQVALERMRQLGVRRLPVAGDRGEVVGVLSLDEIIEALALDLQSVAASLRNERRIEQQVRR